MNISFSGGLTSAFMTKKLIDNYSHEYDFLVTFANTSLEHPKTLEFVNNCDQLFGFKTVWLEAVVHHESRRACTHRIVSYETAKRNGEVFEEVIRKYGIPNVSFLHCTRETKLSPMRSYLKEVAWNGSDVSVAIGIRSDEQRRVRKDATAHQIVYPLVDLFPTDKQDVLDWWEDQSFTLGLPEHEGNCRGCYKKSFNKLFRQLDSDPNALDWHRWMEICYTQVGPQDGDRVFFRGPRSADQVIQLWKEQKGSPTRTSLGMYEDAGCSESCEFLPTDGVI